MRFDNPEQQKFFAELLAQAQYPGHVVPFAAEQMRAVHDAEIDPGPESRSFTPE